MTPQPPVQRVLLVSDVVSATQQISFLRPLEGVVEVTTAEIKPDGAEIVDLLGQIRPEILVMSRVTLPLGRDIMERARELGIPTVFHMDDNLLAVPKSLGLDKYKSYNHPTRLASLRACLNAADLVYVSTAELRTQLLAAGIQAPMTAGHVYCSVGRTEIPDAIPERSSTPVIGYMGTSGHAADLALVAPAIGALMDRRPELRFEIFGDLAVPEALARHAGRVRVIAQTKTYDDYLRQLLSLGWWAGLAPLEDNPFNRCKADTKWVEYTRGGIPVVASDLPVYASACAAGTGRLAGADMAEWQAHIATLLDDAEAASRQVRAARAKLAGCYGTEVLRDQVMTVFDLARRLHRSEEASVPDIVMSGAGAASPARARRDTRAIANVLLIANAAIPTLQLSFLKPLAPLAASGRITISLVTETELIEEMGNLALKPEGAEWMRRRLAGVKPDIIVCCRYSGPHTEQILKRAAHLKIPVVFHIDDDLLNIPPEIGAAKHAAHNKPRRLLTVRTLLAEADLVYCSTAALERRLRGQGVRRPIRHGAVYCTSRVLRQPGSGPIRRIGYMGFDHAHDFEIARPAIEAVLDAHPEIEFELFGSIPMPDGFLRFGERARSVPPVRDYQAFLQALAEREWDIGICPLARTPFNAVKANTKWIEYTASGMAVVASAGMVYDHCMRGGRGLLVDDDEWGPALEMLIARPDLARAMAEASQRRLLAEYSETVLRDQVLDVLDEAIALHRAKGNPPALAGLIRTVA